MLKVRNFGVRQCCPQSQIQHQCALLRKCGVLGSQAATQFEFSDLFPQCQWNDQADVKDAAAVACETGGSDAHGQFLNGAG